MKLTLYEVGGEHLMTIQADRPQVGELFFIARNAPPPEMYEKQARLVRHVSYWVGLGNDCSCDVSLSAPLTSEEFRAYCKANGGFSHAD